MKTTRFSWATMILVLVTTVVGQVRGDLPAGELRYIYFFLFFALFGISACYDVLVDIQQRMKRHETDVPSGEVGL